MKVAFCTEDIPDTGANTDSTVDTDVLVIMIGIFHDLITMYPYATIWIGLGMGKYVQIISANATCAPRCDTTSCFFGNGKKSTLDTVKSFPDVTETFNFLQDHSYYQMDKDDSIFKLLERFIVVLYDKPSNVINVNEARKEIFTKRNRTLENIPLTQVN